MKNTNQTPVHYLKCTQGPVQQAYRPNVRNTLHLAKVVKFMLIFCLYFKRNDPRLTVYSPFPILPSRPHIYKHIISPCAPYVAALSSQAEDLPVTQVCAVTFRHVFSELADMVERRSTFPQAPVRQSFTQTHARTLTHAHTFTQCPYSAGYQSSLNLCCLEPRPLPPPVQSPDPLLKLVPPSASPSRPALRHPPPPSGQLVFIG